MGDLAQERYARRQDGGGKKGRKEGGKEGGKEEEGEEEGRRKREQTNPTTRSPPPLFPPAWRVTTPIVGCVQGSSKKVCLEGSSRNLTDTFWTTLYCVADASSADGHWRAWKRLG